MQTNHSTETHLGFFCPTGVYTYGYDSIKHVRDGLHHNHHKATEICHFEKPQESGLNLLTGRKLKSDKD